MSVRFRHILPLATVLLLALASCSTKKNTASTRWWHSFTARYNTFYNGSQAFIEGEKSKIEGHKDDYTEQLPFFLVGSENSRETGKSSFETAITKCQKAIQQHSIKRKPTVDAGKRNSPKMKAYLQRKEFNPFLKKAWLLMGQAQFEKGDFFEAAATFSYITRLYAAEPEVAAEARQWMARCYVQAKWYYEAEDALSKVRRDSMSTRLSRLTDATQADLLLAQERYAEAVPYIERSARATRNKYLKARLYFLLGQVNRQLGKNREAYKALGRCIKLSPPFELAFNARILQTEVMAGERQMDKKMISKLKRMARSDNNKEYLDQVYYAMGNIFLLQSDTAQAIGAYETGRAKSTRNGIEKGVLLLRLGEIYWDRRKFASAQQCYTEALGLIDKTREGFDEATRRSKVLDKLVPYTSAVELQDSLQLLARMSEDDRNAAIDRVIEALKKKEEEERRARADSLAKARAEEYGMGDADNNQQPTQTGKSKQDNQVWYFYNTTQVMQGKQDFKRRWGNRKNEDDWRRSNHTVVQMDDHEGYDYEAEDSLQAVQDSLDMAAVADTLAAPADSAANDPHQREYYLKQIPFSEEAKAASDVIIQDGLYNAGIIEKDDLGDLPLAAETLERLVRQYPACEQIPDACYQLFLLYSRWQRDDRAEQIRNQMRQQFPDHELTRIITDPDYERNARYGREIEDSLYTATYEAYRRRDNATVAANFQRSTDKFPQGLNRPKFIFVHTLSRLGEADSKTLVAELRDLVSKFPDSDVSPLAGMIVKGLESGRQLGTGHFDISSLWDRRSAEAEADSARAGGQRKLTDGRDVPFVFLLAYPTDSIDSSKLLYEMAYFNFTSFVVRGFDMSQSRMDGLSLFQVSGFSSFDEAHAYAQRVYRAKELAPYLSKCRSLLISKENLELLGISVSFNEYQQYYDEHFAPLKLEEKQQISEEPPIEQHYEDEYTPEELDRMNQSGDSPSEEDDGGEWYSE